MSYYDKGKEKRYESTENVKEIREMRQNKEYKSIRKDLIWTLFIVINSEVNWI